MVWAKSAGWGWFVTGALSKCVSERCDLQGRPWLACGRWPCGSSEAGGCCPPAWGCSRLASRSQRHEGCCKPLPSSIHRTTTTDPAPSSIATAATRYTVKDEVSSSLPTHLTVVLPHPVLLRQLSQYLSRKSRSEVSHDKCVAAADCAHYLLPQESNCNALLAAKCSHITTKPVVHDSHSYSCNTQSVPDKLWMPFAIRLTCATTAEAARRQEGWVPMGGTRRHTQVSRSNSYTSSLLVPSGSLTRVYALLLTTAKAWARCGSGKSPVGWRFCHMHAFMSNVQSASCGPMFSYKAV